MIQRTCPDGGRLQALLEEGGARDDTDELVHHLESCPDCQEVLQELAAPPDVWACAARGLMDEARAEPTLHRLVRRLKEEDPQPAQDDGLSFLRPADKPGVLGLLDRYEVQEEIGRGGMGVVLKAVDPDLNRVVAIKVLSPWLASNATARRRFVREAKAAAAVCHDHIVTVHGVDATDGLPYLVMQYVAGESLQVRLDRTGPLAVEEVVRIGLQTATGLAAAHAQGLIHRDIKPANLLLENGVARVKITDFGLARMADDVGLTQEGVIAGTPEYMAPEQARGEVVDHRADLFSLGSVLYAMCTGSPPFRGSTMLAVLRQVNEEEPMPLRSLNPDVPPWLETFIARLMAKDPAERFPSAAEIAHLLEGYLAHLRQPTTVPPPEVSSLPGNARARSPHLSWSRFAHGLPPRVWLSALAALVVVGLGISFWFRPGIQPVNQAAVDQEKPPPPQGGDKQRKQDHLVVDLPAGTDKLPSSFSLFGPNVDSVVKADPQGWRITLPAGRANADIVGLQLSSRLSGDFTITLGYELLTVGQPLPKYGAGVVMRAFFDTPSPLSAIVSRSYKPEGQLFGGHKIVTGSDNKEQYLESRQAKATRSRGKLRLVRTGPQLQYLVAEEGQDFQIIQSVEVGKVDVRKVQVYCHTMYTPIALDVRWTELDIRADGIDGQDQPPARQRKQDHLVVDLPAGIDKLPPSLSLFGPDAESVVKADPQGWRITLPAERDNTDIVGLQLPSLGGDFAISLAYELLTVGKPLPRYGAGVSMRVWFQTPAFSSAMLSRNNSSYHNPQEQAFAAFKILKDPDGQEKYLDTVVEKAHRSRGKLRMVRTGSRLQYFVAEEGQDFRLIQSVEIGTADVREARVFCTTGYTPIALDVRWTELDIRAERIDGQGQTPALEPLSSEQSSRQSRPKKWLIALALCVGTFLSFAALGWWFLARRSRRAAKERISATIADRPEVTPSAAPVLSFACSACGKRLKVKAELSGKKVKCPQCGHVAVVPAADTYRAEKPEPRP